MLLMLVVAALVSCQKNGDELLPTTEVAAQQDALKKVKVENGYLVFEDMAHHDAVMQQVIAMTDAQRQLWEKQLSFQSYNTLYNAATEAYSNAETLTETENVLAQNQDIMTLDADQTPQRTLRYGSLALLFNRQGIVKFDNQLKQCTADDKQVIVFDGDLTTLAAARAAGRTNVAAKVYVFDVQRSSQSLERGPNLKECSNWMGSIENCNPRKKVRGQMDCFLDTNPPQAGSTNVTRRALAEVHTNAYYRKKVSFSWKWADFDTPNLHSEGSFATTGTASAPVIPSTNFNDTALNENHIDRYWASGWIAGTMIFIPEVWFNWANGDFRLTNNTCFNCETSSTNPTNDPCIHQPGETLTCHIQ